MSHMDGLSVGLLIHFAMGSLVGVPPEVVEPALGRPFSPMVGAQSVVWPDDGLLTL